VDDDEKSAGKLPDIQDLGADGFGWNVGDGVLVATKTKIFLGGCEGAFCVLWQHPATRTAAQGVAESVAKNPRRNVGRQHCVAVLY
jgi:hypothetical protein